MKYALLGPLHGGILIAQAQPNSEIALFFNQIEKSKNNQYTNVSVNRFRIFEFWVLEKYINFSLYSLLNLGRFFSFLILYAVVRVPWTGDQPVAKPLPTHTAI
jgi:hypothetical protein